MPTPTADDLYDDATLIFREQADGRKVSRLPNGKIVLIALSEIPKVKDGERWLVRLEHRDTFAVAFPLDKIAMPAAAASTAKAEATESLPALMRGPVAPSQPLGAIAMVRKETASGTLSEARPALAEIAVRAPVVTTVPVNPSTVVQEGDRVALFVDGANTDGASRSAGYFLDYGKARKYFVADGSFYGAFYFVADFTHTDPLQTKFLDYLSHNGFVVRRKAVKKLKDESSGEAVFKSNVDVEVVVELLNTQDNYDVAFLFSGDSDYERVVDILRSRGKRVYVVGSRPSLSRELAYVADKPIFYLEDHRGALERGERGALP